MSGIVVFCKKVKSIFQSFSATTVDVPIQAPRRPRVIEARPDGSHRDLIGILGLHLPVEIAEVFATPMTAVRRPAFWSRVHPRVAAIESGCILRRRIVFVEQDGTRFPLIHRLTNLIPVGIPPLWKYEDDRTSFIQQVSISSHSAWTDVLLVCDVHGFECILGGMAVVFLGLVIHE